VATAKGEEMKRKKKSPPPQTKAGPPLDMSLPDYIEKVGKQVGIVCIWHGTADGVKECPTCKLHRTADMLLTTLRTVLAAHKSKTGGTVLHGTFVAMVEGAIKAATAEPL
jgi:hypothetical protein